MYILSTLDANVDNLDVDMVYTNVVSLNTIYNFVVEVFYLKSFRVPNMCSKFIDFEIQNLEFLSLLFEVISNIHIVNNKINGANLIYIFSIDKFFI